MYLSPVFIAHFLLKFHLKVAERVTGIEWTYSVFFSTISGDAVKSPPGYVVVIEKSSLVEFPPPEIANRTDPLPGLFRVSGSTNRYGLSSHDLSCTSFFGISVLIVSVGCCLITTEVSVTKVSVMIGSFAAIRDSITNPAGLGNSTGILISLLASSIFLASFVNVIALGSSFLFPMNSGIEMRIREQIISTIP